MNNKNLIEKAKTARINSYSPYSKFSVGAALLCKNGNVYTGCNIENASFSATICAERVAFSNAVSNGEKVFSSIAIVGGKNGESPDFCPPCGICRQVMSEFCNKDFLIILEDNKGNIVEKTFSEIFPLVFSCNEIGG